MYTPIAHTKTRVNLDGGPSFTAHIESNTWNGWVMPYFTREEGMKIVEEINKHVSNEKYVKTVLTYDMDTDSFIEVQVEKDPFDVRVTTYPSMFVETSEGYEEPLYPIGTAYWGWDFEDAKDMVIE